ncbi:NAD(P)/FAD-dependent oxidoreductase [Tropicimonas sp. IMCC6043]|uniref:NAD(P)/FAD-dependent oxidoreductase n=1 Tax=Tropicimonas sp. IMCC6043 TaxID=2510645 RepID=UPI00101D2B7E|nr:FAD-dependent oxidoreductase [Tropicimonas sp. IMCC6043]RYH10336.1 N-acyl homoserine lactone synthase [Tropicimonas sp. IMCC6043]
MTGRLVIVGGGYLGSELARAMDTRAQVTLVEPREAFCHSPAMIRALVQPDLVDKALIPYDGLLRRGEVVRARAIAVDGESVTLDDGSRRPADAVVVATGSQHGAAFKTNGGAVGALREANRALQSEVAAARRIAILGGGALGVELAGEIRAALPDTQVTLISDRPLLDGYPPKLGQGLARQLGALGVQLRIGPKAVDLVSHNEPFSGPVRLEDGSSVDVDLVIPALGSRPDTALLDPLPGLRKGPDGRVLCDRWMRPSDLPNLFAAGDVADIGDPMTIVGATRQVSWLIRALGGLLAGRRLDRTPAYAPWPSPPILVPLGPRMGQSILPVAGLVGAGPTRLLKGRELFLPKYHKMFRAG